MWRKNFYIGYIPAILWGEQSEKVIIAVHGSMSDKADIPIELLAKLAVPKGYQVLSFDLPEHGDRKQQDTLCNVQNCVKDLEAIMKYVKAKWQQISLFANSMGGYFSLIAYEKEPLMKAWFLSPVVDMQRLIENMMTWSQVTEEQLKQEQTIPTPFGQTLYWDYYCYVKEHPINHWDTPTYILYGEKDGLCEGETITRFCETFSCRLQIVQDAEHYFHTPEDLRVLKDWLLQTL